MIQKKICMVGVFGTGKTSLVRRFVQSKFSEKYLSTVGVKIDRKQVEVPTGTVNLLLWDLAGKDDVENVRTSYLKGAAGIFLVADGTRRETYDDLFSLRKLANDMLGPVPTVVALNKYDLMDDWALNASDYQALTDAGLNPFLTSAKNGDGVEDAFLRLAEETVKK